MISIDSRGAGEGKTTTGIYPKIELLQALNENVLLVVPGKELQKQYEDYFANPDFVKINSDTDDGVCFNIIKTLTNRKNQIICITHEAFIRMAIPLHIKKHWHLIIDEAFMPFRSVSWTSSNNAIDWSNLIELPKDLVLDDTIPFVTVTIRDQEDSWTEQIREVMQLKNRDWETQCRTDSYQLLKSNTCGRAEFIQILTISRIQHWKSVHIAAAAFEQTFMRYWLDYNHEPYEIKFPFVRRQLPIIVHSPEELNWSKYKQQKSVDIIQRYSEYVNRICAEEHLEPLCVRNNSSKNKLDNELKLKHNPHGMNHLTHFSAVSLETALNPSGEFVSWFKQNLDLKETQITSAFSSYMFYQILMRTCLRLKDNTQTCHVFILDFKTLVELGNYISFDINQMKTIDVGVKPKSLAAKRMERMRKRQKGLLDPIRP